MTDPMTEQLGERVDELGPVDWIVVELPVSRFMGEIAPALDDIAAPSTIGVLTPTVATAAVVAYGVDPRSDRGDDRRDVRDRRC